MIRFAALLTALFGLLAGGAMAHVSTASDAIVSGLSQDRVQITSTYNGTNLMIFGAIEDPAATGAADIVIQVIGPRENITVRRKERIAGIWLNTEKAHFTGMPAYYHLVATRPVTEIAPPGTLLRDEIGLNAITPHNHRIGGRREGYRQALIRRLRASRMYAEDDKGIAMLSHRLFRVFVPLPAAAPRGRYLVRVYLFRDGTLVGQQNTPFFVDQIGLERRILHFSHSAPIFYGLFAVLMAMVLGWLATVVPQLTRRP